MAPAPSVQLQAATPTSLNMHSPTSSPHSPSWKSVFLRRKSSSKKIGSNGSNGSPLTLDTRTLSSSQVNGNSKSPITGTPKTSLTPASVLSVDQRSSYNSSNTQSTQSSESNAGPQARPYPTQGQRPYSSHQYGSKDTADAHSVAVPKRMRTKSEKQPGRGAQGRQMQRGSQTAHPSQTSFGGPRSPPVTPSASGKQGSGALSPKSMGALPRFIRRVASAPNAKDLFSKSRSASTTTKNGLLAPAANVPPVPAMPYTTSSEQGNEHGNDSLETASSSSSRGRTTLPVRMPNSNGLNDGPGKAAFRRTYSSNSIKVRQVSCMDLSSDGFLC